MGMFPSLRKTLRPSPKAIVPAEVKWMGAGYFGDLAGDLTRRTGRRWSVDRAVVEGYERIVWVFKPVNVIAENQRARRFVLRQGNEEVDDHPQMRLLNTRANPLETGRQFRKRLSAQILLSRPGAFVEVQRARSNTPLRYDLLPPHRVRIIPGNPAADPNDIRSLVDHYELIERDGIRSRPIEPENVLWFRDPHPLDPYSGMTPLEAAGLSVELDHFARLYNVMFLRNDGRPGGIVAVHGDLDPAEQAVIERKFDKGPAAAGKLTVISADGMSFVDPAAKPRDISYQQLSKNAKIELLSSFGVSESMMGYSGDKTFANAEQERLGFWMDTMPPHLSIITDGFNEDSDDDLEPGFDLSDVEVLVKLRHAKLDRAQAEVTAGLRSPFSYAQLAGDMPEIEDTIHTRSLYIPSGKQPLPVNQADADEMGLGAGADDGGGGDPNAGGAPAGDGTGADGPSADDVNTPVGAGGPGTQGGPNGGPDGNTGSAPPPPAAAPAAAAAAPRAAGGAAAGALAAARASAATMAQQTKSGRVVLRVVGAKSDDAWMSDDLDEEARDQLERDIAQALTEVGEDLVERAIARMSSVKARKHTRHWQPQGDRPVDTRVQTKALDPTYAVDETDWQQQTEEKVSPILVAAAILAAERTWSSLSGIGGDTVRLPGKLADAVIEGAHEVATFIGDAASRMASRLSAAINDGDQAGLPMDQLVDGVRAFKGRIAGWADSLGIQAGTATTEGARALAAADVAAPILGGEEDSSNRPDEQLVASTTQPPADTAASPSPPSYSEVTQAWRTRGDDKVRPTHAKAALDNKKVPVGGLFEVGGYLMRYPGDPLAPPSETRNCRCSVTYRHRRTGRFVPTPMTPATPIGAAL